VQRPLTSGPRGWPVGPTLPPPTGWLRGDTLQETIEGNPKLKVGGGRIPWPIGDVARPATTWRVIDLTKSVTPPWTLLNNPLSVKIKATHTTCCSPLVNVLV
jgi:hypothetical protein